MSKPTVKRTRGDEVVGSVSPGGHGVRDCFAVQGRANGSSSWRETFLVFFSSFSFLDYFPSFDSFQVS